MASDVAVGDSEIATLVVAPADTGTQVTLTVTAPDGTATPVVMTGGPLSPVTGSTDQQQTWTASTPVTYAQPGRWVLAYTVTGTGEGAEDLEVYVVPSPVAGGPTWWPGRSEVAKYVPHRTLERSLTSTIGSADSYAFTFTANTVPSGLQADHLIADGAAWITARLTPMADSIQPAARVAVSLYAAAACERGYPDDDQSLQRANDLEKRLDLMVADLVGANDDANGSGYGLDIAPMWAFPAADPRYDSSCYW